MDRPTLEQLALTTEPQMVRRRFDEHNLVWAYTVAWLFVVSSLALVPFAAFKTKSPALHVLAAAIDVLLTLFLLSVMSQLRQAKRNPAAKPLPAFAATIGRNLPTWLIALFVTKFAVLEIFAMTDRGGWVAWAVIFPIGTIVLRLLLQQRVVLYAGILTIFAAVGLLAPAHVNIKEAIAICAGVGFASAATFAIGALASRALKRTAIEEGSQRRTEAREQLRIRDELRFAREVQISMLPEGPPMLAWADIAGISLPATEVGGDYYDYYVVDGRLAVICGDVAGHGLASGITLSALRSGFTLLRDALLDPAHVLERLQEVVTQSSRRRMMVTISVLLLDPDTHKATIASAGHPPLIHIRNSKPEFIELFSTPLGARLGANVPQHVLPFTAGDVFVLHSDGIYETVSEHGETYGLERLARVVAVNDGTAEEIRDAVLRDVEGFRGDEPQLDDVTLVVVRIV
ncbi:MAG: phosphoserine phosphatase RsbU/P [Thermoanaerobaculia bacterium]|jgi:serine phosphatase RsbU (regulator of sigma subunit)|nr:phosphoserine phosphatase RsbU/P [Thermoanaerobaculia bacterium]